MRHRGGVKATVGGQIRFTPVEKRVIDVINAALHQDDGTSLSKSATQLFIRGLTVSLAEAPPAVRAEVERRLENLKLTHVWRQVSDPAWDPREASRSGVRV